MYTSNELMGGDWKKGPQGTGQTSWELGFIGDSTLEGPELADSWELPDSTTIIYHIHKGARFQNKPPANGREVTAQDVVWNMEMQFNYPTAWQASQYPSAKNAEVTGQVLSGGDPRRPTSFKALDKYTVEVKVPADSQGIMFLEIGDNAYTNPPEVWVGPNAPGMAKWQNVVGSGPFILSNYVPGSIIEYSKSPDYFEEDPLYPGNKWPYINGVKELIIPDVSTRQAAFRTGKLDKLDGQTPEDGKLLLKQQPKLQYVQRSSTSPLILSGRQDKPNLPFKDIRVRQALNMAVDKEIYLKSYLQGEGALLGYPYPKNKAWEKYYTPLEEMPKTPQLPGSIATVPELFKYDPDRARQILKDAGYPNGFKAKVQVQNVQANVDQLSIIKDNLGKIGVELTIVPLEPGVWSSMDAGRTHEEMIYGGATGIWAPHEQLPTKSSSYSNKGMFNDPYYDEVGMIIGRDIVKNPDNFIKTLKAEGVYELESAWGLWMPIGSTYGLWWPWVENYYGINWTGWANTVDWYKGIWINEDLKKSMGY
jgi:peptide/nickel transport system substrate-binding protein